MAVCVLNNFRDAVREVLGPKPSIECGDDVRRHDSHETVTGVSIVMDQGHTRNIFRVDAATSNEERVLIN